MLPNPPDDLINELQKNVLTLFGKGKGIRLKILLLYTTTKTED